MEEEFILALNQGTTSLRAIIFDHNGHIKSVTQKELTQYLPQSGWVEHNPNEVWSLQASVIAEAISATNINGLDIVGIGITDQRETTIVWDVDTEEPVYNAIVWQGRRTSEFCDELKAQGLTDKIHEKTGLIINAHFSGIKIKWILDNVPGAHKRAEMDKLRFGNVDSWLVWRLTRREAHVTDVANVSRTTLFNIHDLKWDEELTKLLDIPVSMMPEVGSSSEAYGHTKTTISAHEMPISSITGDQQAALSGQMRIEPGPIKNTYDTSCFVMLNTGNKPVMSRNNLLTTIAWKIGNQVVYALEGSTCVEGSVVQWLHDGLGFITLSSEIEDSASTVPNSGGAYFAPALTGLAAPYWDQYACGTIIDITRGTARAHITRAALDGIALQTYDIAQAVAKDMNASLTELKVDGDVSRNNLLMQTQADLLGIKVVRPHITETTALSAAYLAGLTVGFWKNINDTKSQWQAGRCFEPITDSDAVEAAKAGWADAIDRTLTKR